MPSLWEATSFCKRQRLTDDELEAIVRPLRELQAHRNLPTLPMAPECIAAEINFRAERYLRDRERERQARHPSKMRRDLDQGAERLGKVLDWFRRGGHERRRTTGLSRIEAALAWLDRLGQRGDLWRWLGIAGRPERDPDVAAARRALQDAHGSVAAGIASLPDLAPVAELRGLIECAAAQMEQSHGEKTSHRRSRARGLFLDQLADLFEEATGCRPTYTWDSHAGHTTSPFAQFALVVLKTVDPEATEKQRGAESDIQAAAGRKRHRHYVSDELTTFDFYEDPRDRKSSRGRIGPR